MSSYFFWSRLLADSRLVDSTPTHDPDYQPTRSHLRVQRARLDTQTVFTSNQFNRSLSHYTLSLIFSPRHADGHLATLSSLTSILAPRQFLERDALQLQRTLTETSTWTQRRLTQTMTTTARIDVHTLDSLTHRIPPRRL
jgi:hypothetical protein